VALPQAQLPVWSGVVESSQAGKTDRKPDQGKEPQKAGKCKDKEETEEDSGTGVPGSSQSVWDRSKVV
jgi:hypothetical protein